MHAKTSLNDYKYHLEVQLSYLILQLPSEKWGHNIDKHFLSPYVSREILRPKAYPRRWSRQPTHRCINVDARHSKRERERERESERDMYK